MCQAQANDKRLMTDVEYKTFLVQVETELPKWETTLKRIDLEKLPQISYSQGKSIADNRDICLMEIGNIRTSIVMQRNKRTVYGELALKGYLNSLNDVGEDIVWAEVLNGLTLTNIEKYVPELGSLIMRLGNDVLARVALLEKGTCP